MLVDSYRFLPRSFVPMYAEAQPLDDERENITPGGSTSLETTLAAGSYELVCGDGSRKGTLTIKVRDQGRWRLPRRQPSRGMFIMRELADRVEVDRASGGTTVTIVRRLGSESGDRD